ncbi:MAG: ABC transporter ATP-binding protein [Treponema sp.]|jgi:ABC-type Fe3+/spermidine/putrescine transport system ATPase subunit|nr:ABC transporter ATP-binding protein [Treponema sp.]
MRLEAKGLRKRYGTFGVTLDFAVNSGEILVLAGPSGCGKTTALNLIAGLINAEGGELLIDGEDAGGLPPWKRNIAVVFQDLALFPHLTVGQNVAYGPFIQGIGREERRRIVGETLEKVRLRGFEKRRVHTLSGGERQRAAIARALAASPRALLMDEPFSSLDAPLRRELRGEFREMLSRSNCGVERGVSSRSAPCVFVTHDREEAAALGDRIALMADGEIRETGTGRELFLSPKTEFTARFFGAGDVWPCVVGGGEGGRFRTQSPLGTLSVFADSGAGGTGTAPENLRLFVPRDALCLQARPRQNGVPQRVCKTIFKRALFEGSSLRLELELPSGERFTVEAGPRAGLPDTGSAVAVYIDESLLRLVR